MREGRNRLVIGHIRKICGISRQIILRLRGLLHILERRGGLIVKRGSCALTRNLVIISRVSLIVISLSIERGCSHILSLIRRLLLISLSHSHVLLGIIVVASSHLRCIVLHPITILIIFAILWVSHRYISNDSAYFLLIPLVDWANLKPLALFMACFARSSDS